MPAREEQLHALLQRLVDAQRGTVSDKSLTFELERTPKVSYNELSTRVLPGGRCDVRFHITWGKNNVVNFLRAPWGYEDVEGLLLRTCKEKDIVLAQCHITLNGHAFHVQKGMQVKDLPDDLVRKCPWFEIDG
jgi:hypothetical protein